jgi:HEPN domain-containing protein
LNRTELQRLCEERIEDARALLAASRWPGAYYLAGYAVECALKSCVLAYVERTGVIFEDRRFAERCWTHDIEALVAAANLLDVRGVAISASTRFGGNWHTCSSWSEASRYCLSTRQEAEELFEAVTNVSDGVLKWIRMYW